MRNLITKIPLTRKYQHIVFLMLILSCHSNLIAQSTKVEALVTDKMGEPILDAVDSLYSDTITSQLDVNVIRELKIKVTQDAEVVSVIWPITGIDLSALDYFGVEKSADGLNFEEFFQITKEDLQANISYCMVSDYSPTEGINFYRLVLVDTMAFKLHSETESVFYNPPANLNKIRIYCGDDCSRQLIVIVDDKTTQFASLKVFDEKNALILEENIIKGENFFELENTLRAGVYNVEINTGFYTFNVNIVIDE